MEKDNDEEEKDNEVEEKDNGEEKDDDEEEKDDEEEEKDDEDGNSTQTEKIENVCSADFPCCDFNTWHHKT
ncbi:hypothetical protein AVEN_127122-1 [Araneus ventricosus]|uniref:Uncharacterized protein n=1 Tax=Araneus ventricosus TaxID=182803 RepID=A0A4Y2QI58_ARAVE|nr:hypothetical protein AVEN_127122-1 [Araneus ventricosus]